MKLVVKTLIAILNEERNYCELKESIMMMKKSNKN